MTKQYQRDKRKVNSLFGSASLIAIPGFIGLFKDSLPIAVFFFFGAGVFVLLGVLVRCKYSIVDDHLVFSNLLNIWAKRVPLKKIRNVYYDDRPIPAIGFQSIVTLFLRDSRFNRWTSLEVRGKKKKLGKIDAHYLTSASFKKLHSDLSKVAKSNKG